MHREEKVYTQESLMLAIKRFRSVLCLIARNMNLQPVAHLMPVLRYLKERHYSLNTVHFWSDGPTIQYRNKHHMLFANHLLYDEGNYSFIRQHTALVDLLEVKRQACE